MGLSLDCRRGSLCHNEPVIYSLAPHKLGMCAYLGNSPLIQNDKPIRAAERGKPVGYGYCGPSLDYPVKGSLYLLLGLCIKTCRSLVKNNYLRIAEYRSGNGYALSFSA